MIRTTITMPRELLKRVDEFAGDGGRSAWIVEAVEARAKREHLGRVLEETRGALRRHVRARGRRAPLGDAFIAALAPRVETTVVTRNVRDFEPFGVQVLGYGDPMGSL